MPQFLPGGWSYDIMLYVQCLFWPMSRLTQPCPFPCVLLGALLHTPTLHALALTWAFSKPPANFFSGVRCDISACFLLFPMSFGLAVQVAHLVNSPACLRLSMQWRQHKSQPPPFPSSILLFRSYPYPKASNLGSVTWGLVWRTQAIKPHYFSPVRSTSWTWRYYTACWMYLPLHPSQSLFPCAGW